MLCAVLSQPHEIGRPIRVAKEHVFATVAALRDVVRDPGEDGAGESWHAGSVAASEKVCVPFIANSTTLTR